MPDFDSKLDRTLSILGGGLSGLAQNLPCKALDLRRKWAAPEFGPQITQI